MLSRAENKRLQALRRRKGREESAQFIAEGVRPVEDAVASGIVLQQPILAPSLEDNPRGAQLALTLRQRVHTMEVTERELRDIASTETPQGVAVVAHIPRRELGDVVLHERALVVLLDAVQDPGNFGTIVRSADAFAAAAVIALTGTVDPWNGKAVRAAMGSSFRVPVIESTLATVQPWLSGAGFRIVGADTDGVGIEQYAATSRTALVLGNEGAGLSKGVREIVDASVAVPIRGHAESLNVGVAAGILLYLLSRSLET
jgi:TrmH family RNA methyltransferase